MIFWIYTLPVIISLWLCYVVYYVDDFKPSDLTIKFLACVAALVFLPIINIVFILAVVYAYICSENLLDTSIQDIPSKIKDTIEKFKTNRAKALQEPLED